MNNSGFIALAIVGTIMTGLIAGGIYYSQTTKNELIPTGMRSYSNVRQDNYYGGKRKTYKNKYSSKKTRRI